MNAHPQIHIELVRQQQLDLQRRLARPRATSRPASSRATGSTSSGKLVWRSLLARIMPVLPRRHGA